nr:MAG: hypothetical protein [Penaeus semisulcatus pemonivirus]
MVASSSSGSHEAGPSRASNNGQGNKKTAGTGKKTAGTGKKKTAGTNPLRRVYKVPLRVPSGRNVDNNWALVSAMLRNTVDMPIGNAEFWNEPFSTLLKNVQLSKSNKKKFKEVLQNGRKKVCPKSCKRRESDSLMHPQRFIYLYRLKTHLSLLNSKIRNAMEKQGFQLYKPTPEEEERRRNKVKKVTDNPTLLDPVTGEVLSKDKTQEVLEVARDDNDNRDIPIWMKNFPGIRKKKPRDQSTKLKASKLGPGTFFGTPYRLVRRQSDLKKRIAENVGNALSGTRLQVANGMSVTGTGSTFYIPVKFKNDRSLNDSGYLDEDNVVSDFEDYVKGLSALSPIVEQRRKAQQKRNKNIRVPIYTEDEYDAEVSSS